MAIHATLTIKVAYDEAFVNNQDDIQRQLEYAARHLAGEGLLSGETDLLVDEWSYKVEVLN